MGDDLTMADLYIPPQVQCIPVVVMVVNVFVELVVVLVVVMAVIVVAHCSRGVVVVMVALIPTMRVRGCLRCTTLVDSGWT